MNEKFNKLIRSLKRSLGIDQSTDHPSLMTGVMG